MVTSGYNNVNAPPTPATAAATSTCSTPSPARSSTRSPTGVGDAATPSGLAQINNYVDNVAVDNTTLRAYGGDVLGNIWRFDLSTPPAGREPRCSAPPRTRRHGAADHRSGRSSPSSTASRWCSSAPASSSVRRDVADPQMQSVYGIVDTLTGAARSIADPLRSRCGRMRISQSGSGAGARTGPSLHRHDRAVRLRRDGWVLDLAGGRRARQRRDEARPRRAGVRQQHSARSPLHASAATAGSTRSTSATGAPIPDAISAREYLADSLNVGFNVLQLALAAGGGNPTYTRRFRQTKASNINKDHHSAGAAAGRQADQLARDRPVGRRAGGAIAGERRAGRPAGSLLAAADRRRGNARRSGAAVARRWSACTSPSWRSARALAGNYVAPRRRR